MIDGIVNALVYLMLVLILAVLGIGIAIGFFVPKVYHYLKEHVKIELVK